jgi:hypothetical protein
MGTVSDFAIPGNAVISRRIIVSKVTAKRLFIFPSNSNPIVSYPICFPPSDVLAQRGAMPTSFVAIKAFSYYDNGRTIRNRKNS